MTSLPEYCFVSVFIKDETELNIKELHLNIFSTDINEKLLGRSNIIFTKLNKNQPFVTNVPINFENREECKSIKNLKIHVKNCVEINQNTTAVRGATQQAVSSQVSEMYRLVAENERMSLLLSQAFKGISKSDLSESDYISLWMFQMMGLRRIENIYLQYKNGLLTEDAFSRIGMGIYRTKIVREIWEERRGDFEPDFADFFEVLRDKNN